MSNKLEGREPASMLDRTGYELEVEDRFDQPILNEELWIPYYLPQWSSRAASAARYALGDGSLRLLIEAEQEPWTVDYTGYLRVSSLQTGLFAGPVGRYHRTTSFSRRTCRPRSPRKPRALYSQVWPLRTAGPRA